MAGKGCTCVANDCTQCKVLCLVQQNHKINGQRLDVKKALSKSEMAAGGPGGGGSSSGRRGGGRGGGSGGWGNQQDWGNSGQF